MLLTIKKLLDLRNITVEELDSLTVEFTDKTILYGIYKIYDKYIMMIIYDGSNDLVDLAIFVKINDETDLDSIYVNKENYSFEYDHTYYDRCNILDKIKIYWYLSDDFKKIKEIWF